MSIDDYFMQEGEVEERDPSTGKLVRIAYYYYRLMASLFFYNLSSNAKIFFITFSG